jgi:hypothetical protein
MTTAQVAFARSNTAVEATGWGGHRTPLVRISESGATLR